MFRGPETFPNFAGPPVSWQWTDCRCATTTLKVMILILVVLDLLLELVSEEQTNEELWGRKRLATKSSLYNEQ